MVRIFWLRKALLALHKRTNPRVCREAGMAYPDVISISIVCILQLTRWFLTHCDINNLKESHESQERQERMFSIDFHIYLNSSNLVGAVKKLFLHQIMIS